MISFLIGNGRKSGFDWREKELSRTTPLKLSFFLGESERISSEVKIRKSLF